MSKILVGVNTLTSVNQYAYANHCQFWYRLGRNYLEDQFLFFTPPRMSIDRMRNTAAKVALEQEADYLMFIDDDVLIPHNTLGKLRETDYDIIAGVTVIRGYPFNMMMFKSENNGATLRNYNDYVNFIDPLTKIVDADAVGFSCVLIKTELLKKVSAPYFVTGLYNTEDVYFCMKAIEELGRENLRIGVHCGVVTGHIGDAKVYTPDNVSYYRDLEEFENPNLASIDEAKSRGDRGDAYLKSCLPTQIAKA